MKIQENKKCAIKKNGFQGYPAWVRKNWTGRDWRGPQGRNSRNLVTVIDRCGLRLGRQPGPYPLVDKNSPPGGLLLGIGTGVDSLAPKDIGPQHVGLVRGRGRPQDVPGNRTGANADFCAKVYRPISGVDGSLFSKEVLDGVGRPKGVLYTLGNAGFNRKEGGYGIAGKGRNKPAVLIDGMDERMEEAIQGIG